MMDVRSDRQLPFWIFLLIVLCWLLPGLLGHEPWKPDEAYSFGLIRHIAASGDWVVPTLAGEPFMEKPPLYFIVAAGFLKLLGGIFNPPDAARLASGFFLILTFIPVALAARELHGRGFGRWAVLALLGCLGLAVRAHQMITDTALLAGMAWGIYGYILGLRRVIPGALALGFGAAAAFLSKGLLGPGLLGICGILLPVVVRSCRTLRYARFLSIALLVSLPLPLLWMGTLYARSPELFRTWFWVNNFGRFNGTAGLGPRSAGHWFYLTLLPWYALPALPMAFVALWRQRGVLPEIWSIPLTIFTVSLVVLSSAADARELYALPLLPGLAILAPGALRFEQPPSAKWRFALQVLFGLLALVLWIAGLALAWGYPEPIWTRFEASAPGLHPHGSLFILALALIITLSLGWVLIRAKMACHRPLIAWCAGFSLCWGLAMILGMPFLDYTKRYSDPFTQLKHYLPQSGCVSSVHLGEPQRALLEYYAALQTLRVEVDPQAKQCRFMLVETESGKGGIHPDGELLWSGHRAGDHRERYELYRLH